MLVAPEMRVDLSTAPSAVTLLAAHTPVMQVPPVYKTVSSILLANFLCLGTSWNINCITMKWMLD